MLSRGRVSSSEDSFWCCHGHDNRNWHKVSATPWPRSIHKALAILLLVCNLDSAAEWILAYTEHRQRAFLHLEAFLVRPLSLLE